MKRYPLVKCCKRRITRLLLWLVVFGLASGAALVAQTPSISTVNPSQGPIAGGTVVTITGANFLGATLTVDQVLVTPQVISATAISFTSPAHDNGIASINLTTTAGSVHGQFLYLPPALSDLPAGYVTTVAGIGLYSGFYGPATQAEINCSTLSSHG